MKPVRYVRQNLEAFFRDGFSRLPRGPVEPTTLALSWNISNISGDDSDDSGHGLGWGNGSRVGFLLAPCGVRAGNVLVRGVPGFVQLGRPLQFDLTLSHNYPCHKPAERNVAAATIVFHARIDMCLVRKKQKQSRESQELVHATLRLAPQIVLRTVSTATRFETSLLLSLKQRASSSVLVDSTKAATRVSAKRLSKRSAQNPVYSVVFLPLLPLSRPFSEDACSSVSVVCIINCCGDSLSRNKKTLARAWKAIDAKAMFSSAGARHG